MRLDSGDRRRCRGEVRRILDEGGLDATRILCSGDLDEYEIERLVAEGAPIDGFGVGTRLVTGGDVPALGGVYKLVESAGRPVMKTSQARRQRCPAATRCSAASDGDVIGLADERCRVGAAAAGAAGRRARWPEPPRWKRSGTAPPPSWRRCPIGYAPRCAIPLPCAGALARACERSRRRLP